MPYTSAELLQLSRTEKNARKRIRLLAIAYFVEHKNRAEVARTLKLSRTSVNAWVSRYLELGLAGLDAAKAKGRAPYLNAKQRQQLCRHIQQQCLSEQGGRLTGESILRYIASEFSVEYHHNAVYKLLKQLGFSWVTSRSKHPKQQQGVQDAYIKLPTGNDP